jgi:hypothetical protein
MFSSGTSAANRAAPRTLSEPSSRDTGVPISPFLRRMSGSGRPPGIQLSGANGTSFATAVCIAACTAPFAVSTMLMLRLR